jgi:hypothetical protein
MNPVTVEGFSIEDELELGCSASDLRSLIAEWQVD